jgi:hypothetical protein
VSYYNSTLFFALKYFVPILVEWKHCFILISHIPLMKKGSCSPKKFAFSVQYFCWPYKPILDLYVLVFFFFYRCRGSKSSHHISKMIVYNISFTFWISKHYDINLILWTGLIMDMQLCRGRPLSHLHTLSSIRSRPDFSEVKKKYFCLIS